MPKLNKAYRRDEKRRKARYGHTEDGRSVKHLQRIIQQRAEKAQGGS